MDVGRRIRIFLEGRETVSPAATRAADAIEDLGDEAKDSSNDLELLQNRISAVSDELEELARQYARTGDESFVKRIAAQRKELNKLTKIQGLLDSGKGMGEQFGQGLFAGIRAKMQAGSSLFSALPPQMQAGAVAAGTALGVTMAGAVGAALTAGILLAVGGGVMAAGIKAAANSPAVKDAWKAFGDRAKESMKGFGTPFEEPLIRAADTFGDALDRIAPKLKNMSVESAPLVDILAPALASMAERALPGIQTALEASRPLFEKLAEHAPKLGDAISRFFEIISKGSPGAVEALDDILSLIEFLIVHIGNTIFALSKMYEAAKAAWRGIVDVFIHGVRVIINVIGQIVQAAASAFSWIPGIGPKLKNAAADFEKFRQRANNALARIADRNVNVTVSLRGIKNLEEQMAVRLGRRAAGGPVLAGQAYLVGEKGPEILAMGAGSGRIIPNHQIERTLGQGGAVAAPVPVLIPGGRIEALFIEVLREAIRRGGGNVQTVLGAA